MYCITINTSDSNRLKPDSKTYITHTHARTHACTRTHTLTRHARTHAHTHYHQHHPCHTATHTHVYTPFRLAQKTEREKENKQIKPKRDEEGTKEESRQLDLILNGNSRV